jgi:hypothetical protein
VDFVFEFLAVDRAASAAGAGRITSLDHEVRDNAVEDDVVIVASLREGCEVLACLGRMSVVELNGERTLPRVNR